MSYILDALKKSEQDRKAKRSPDVSSLQDPQDVKPGFSTRGFLLILVVVVLVNTALVFYFVEQSRPDVSPVAEPATVATTPPPEIEVTAHIYADAPDLRLARINDVERKEGDYISPGHQLVEIQESGLVLSYRGQQYYLDMTEAW